MSLIMAVNVQISELVDQSYLSSNSPPKFTQKCHVAACVYETVIQKLPNDYKCNRTV